MNNAQKHTIEQMNRWGAEGKPFVFLIDFNFEKPFLFAIDNTSELLWKTPEMQNFKPSEVAKKQVEWEVSPVSCSRYEEAFQQVQSHIHGGDTYLLNLTMPSGITTNLSLEEISTEVKRLIKSG